MWSVLIVAFNQYNATEIKMHFSNEERREIVFLHIDYGLSLRQTAIAFHHKFPHRPVPSKTAIAKLLAKFRATGSVANLKRSGRPRSATNEEHEVLVLGSVYLRNQQSLRHMAEETGLSMKSVHRILKRYKFHPYGIHLVQELDQRDFERRKLFCENMEQYIRDSEFVKHICFSDESTFHITGYVNRHNNR